MEIFHGAFNNIFFLKILLLVLGFVPWRGKPCSSSTGMKTLHYFKMVFGFSTPGVWVWWFEYIDLYTEISRQSCDPEMPHKAVSVRCAFPAVSSPMHVVKQHLAFLSCHFFSHKAIVLSLNKIKIFFYCQAKACQLYEWMCDGTTHHTGLFQVFHFCRGATPAVLWA